MNKLKYTIVSLVILTFCSLQAIAQTGDIRGFIYEKSNGEPVIFTPVYLKGTTIGVTTDVNGYFAISKVKPGKYTLMSNSLGFDTAKAEIEVKAGEIVTKPLYLSKSSVELKAVEISAEKQEQRNEVRISVQKITPKEIKQMASVGGEPDIAQYLQVLPGVVFTGDQGGQLYIRGGSPVQNKVLLDGMIVYNPFHSIGFFSVFDTDILRNVDVYSGGFAANYGGRISSVMDITTRDGNKQHLGGKVGASTFGSKLLLEGPFKKQKEDGSSATYILSAKTSYINTTSKTLYNYRFDETKAQPLNLKSDSTNQGLPFSYTDLYGKISFNSSNGSKFNVFGFNFADRVQYSLADVKWNNYGIGSSFILIPQNASVLIKGHFAYSNYTTTYKEPDLPARQSDVGGFNSGLDFVYTVPKGEVSYGLEVLGFKTNYQFTNAVGRTIQQTENTTEAAAYLKYRINAANGKVVIDPSIRAHYYASLGNFSPEPRLGIKINATDRLRFKGATGIYSQNVISGGSDRDVINLFYGFLSGTDNLPKTFTKEDGTTKNITQKLQKANHYIAGFEYDIIKHLEVNIEGYYKQFTQLTNINRDKIFEDDANNTDKPDFLKKDFIVETGSAKGLDVVLKYDYKRFYFWVTYSLAMVKRWDGRQSYYPIFDRRHNVNLVSSYTFGKGYKWQIDARWNMGSGFPFVPTQGFYENQTFSGNITGNYTTSNGNLGIQYAPLSEQKRLPYYHRFDVTLKRTIEFSNDKKLEANFSVTNMYNRENIFYFDRVRYKRVDQLPILPSIGATFTF